MGAAGAALPWLPGGREVWQAAVAKGYSCFCCAGKGRAIGPHGALGLSDGWQELGLLGFPAPTPHKTAPALSVTYDHH